MVTTSTLEAWRQSRYGVIANYTPPPPKPIVCDDYEAWLTTFATDQYEPIRPTENRAFIYIRRFARARYVARRRDVFAEMYPSTYNKQVHHMTLQQLHLSRNLLLIWLDLGRDIHGKKHITTILTSLETDEKTIADSLDMTIPSPAESVTA